MQPTPTLPTFCRSLKRRWAEELVSLQAKHKRHIEALQLQEVIKPFFSELCEKIPGDYVKGHAT